MKKQTISLLLSLILLLNLLPISALAAGPDSGSLGGNVTWTLDRSTGVLSIEGFGRMEEIGYPEDDSDLRWLRDGDLIREIRFDERITSISRDLFSLLTLASFSDLQRIRNVRTVRVPAAVSVIGSDAFAGCTRLDEITLLNAACLIDESPRTLGVPGRTVVVGYPGSTAERYARNSGYEFRAIGCADGSHVFAETVITPPTCTQDGVTEAVCVLCGYKTRSPIPAGHDYAVTAEPARTVYTCTRCGDSYSVGESVRLKPEQTLDVTVAAGARLSIAFTPETTDRYRFNADQYGAQERYGYQASTGTVCNSAGQPVASEYNTAVLHAGETYYYRVEQVYDDALPARVSVELNHEYVETENTASCTRYGHVTYVCAYCGDTYAVSTGPYGHDYVQTILTAPTCTREGLARFVCSRCGAAYTGVLPAAHAYDYDVETPWYSHGVCSICGEETVSGTENPPELRLNETAAARFGDGNVCSFRFTPDADEMYVLNTSADDLRITGDLFTAGGDWVSGFDFRENKIYSPLSANQTYYYVFVRYDESVADFDVEPEIAHEYWPEATVLPTCEHEGSTTHTCFYCGDTWIETVPAAHMWDYDVEMPWYQHGVCELCGKTGEFGSMDQPALPLGEEIQVELDRGEVTFFSFTPKESESYALRFTDESDAFITGYEADGSNFFWNDGAFRGPLEAGQTYYFGIQRGYFSGALPPMVLEVAHEYRSVFSRSPACEEEGLEVSVCGYCGEIKTETSPPAHRFEFDHYIPWHQRGVCALCGEVFAWDAPVHELRADEAAFLQPDPEDSKVFFRFTPEKTGYYSFVCTGPGDIYYDVYSADGEYCPTDSFFDAQGNRILFVGLHAGWTYYFGVRVYRLEQSGALAATVRLEEDAVETVLRPDESGSMGKGDIAFFRFTPPRDGYYEFYSDADCDAAVNLYDDAGVNLNGFGSVNDHSFRLVYALQAGRDYHLAINSFFDGEEGSFDVSVRGIEWPDPGTVLRLNRAETAKVSRPGENCSFSFTPSSSGYYCFTAESGRDSVCVLYDSEMNPIDYSDDGQTSDFRLTALLEAGKTYYYAVSLYGGETGEFPVVLRQTANWSWPDYRWNGMEEVEGICHDMDHLYITLSETVKTTRLVVREPTYTAPGEALYIAAFQDSNFETQVRSEVIPRLPAPPLPCDGESCPGMRFSDMPARDHWAHDAIDWALVNGVTTGTSETKFSPNAGCTRAQVVTFLWRAAGEPLPADWDHPFTDVDPDAYYFDAMMWALEAGITTGTSAERFSPDAVCTRAQIAAFLWRFEGCAEPGTAASFADVPAGAYYEKAVAWAAEKGITAGTGGGKFSPDSTCTRAQVMTFLYRDRKD